jgi:hypothetical protein
MTFSNPFRTDLLAGRQAPGEVVLESLQLPRNGGPAKIRFRPVVYDETDEQAYSTGSPVAAQLRSKT